MVYEPGRETVLMNCEGQGLTLALSFFPQVIEKNHFQPLRIASDSNFHVARAG